MANNFFDELERYGCFVVRDGEVESWLPKLSVPRGKQGDNSWRANVFAAMGNDPSSDDYIRPAPDDVWNFIGRIGGWLSDAKRRGMQR